MAETRYYLSETGLAKVWGKIKAALGLKVSTVKVNGTALAMDASNAVNLTVVSGDASGAIKVNGSDVAVKGLKSAAYTESSAYDASGAAASVLGSSSDASTAITVYGARKKVEEIEASLNDLKEELDGEIIFDCGDASTNV